MSKYIHELKIGDKLAIKGPIPKFEYKSMFTYLPLPCAISTLTKRPKSTSSTRLV